ncbi:MAG: hypothetical protein U5K74_14375 [Gemmatimonadaceae bacterium]|nr:hypothetical protein [Gemmatimonadaceae bacterium]
MRGPRELRANPIHPLTTPNRATSMHAFLRPARTPLALSALTLLLAACSGDSVVAPGGESEVISRVTLTLTPATGAAVSAYIEDADGNGPGAPSAQVGSLTLVPGTTYAGTIRFENRLVSPIENITTEVVAEADEHRVFYTVTGTGVTVTTTDVDGGGRPLGVTFNAAVAAGTPAGTRTLRAVLCHYADSPKPAAASSCTVDTDIDVSFTATIPI